MKPTEILQTEGRCRFHLAARNTAAGTIAVLMTRASGAPPTNPGRRSPSTGPLCLKEEALISGLGWQFRRGTFTNVKRH